MAKKQFKAESKRLLDLVIHSIYTNKEIFLRELISNASDALDKRYFLALKQEIDKVDSSDLKITLQVNKEQRTLSIIDTGIGMTKEELENNLGTIAKSGSLEFKSQLEKGASEVDIIGQFGVGFYSAFMVANKIEVLTKSAKDNQAYLWTSQGEDGYTIEEANKDEIGTSITLHLLNDENEEDYSTYLEEFTLRQLIKKYSDYVRYPIQMEVEKHIPDPTDKEKTITTTELETLNSMTPIWKKKPKDITEDEYNEFYQAKFNDWQKPGKVLHYTVEGNVSYTALLFIPSKAPYNFYQSDYEAGLQLYSKGVFILEQAKDLLPDAYRFVRGLIDSDDLNLNISREILQQDRQVKALASSIEKKIHNALEDQLKNDRKRYEDFFHQFGLNLKYALYQSYGMQKDQLQDLLLFKSSKENGYVTFKEYVERMKEGQKEIYYASGESVEDIQKLPALKKVTEKEYEVLYLTDSVDEFVIQVLREYDGKTFKSITSADLDLNSEEEKKELEKKAEDNKSILESMKEILKEKVQDVRLSSRLTDDPVTLVSADGLSIEMEKVLSKLPQNTGMKAAKILEINAEHPIFAKLQQVHQSDKACFDEYVDVLYQQALLIEGLPIENPAEYTKKIVSLMVK